MMLTHDTIEGLLERRLHERLDGVFNARYIPLSSELGRSMEQAAGEMGLVPEPALEAQPMRRGVTTNLSEGGFCLISDHRIEQGTRLLLDVNLPGLPRPVRALCEVRRSAPAPSNPALTRLGLKLLAIHPEGLERLKTMVAEGIQTVAA